MNLTEVLHEFRAPCVGFMRAMIRSEREQRFGFFMKKQTVFVEPIAPTADGSRRPTRIDIGVQRPKETELRYSQLSFDDGSPPPQFNGADMQFISGFASGLEFLLYPFWWDRCDVSCSGPVENWQPVFDWYARWFDAEGKRPGDADGLHNVVHSMTEPATREGKHAFRVDLGSVSFEGFLELLETLNSMKLTEISVRTN